jgi:hypothetical protein
MKRWRDVLWVALLAGFFYVALSLLLNPKSSVTTGEVVFLYGLF